MKYEEIKTPVTQTKLQAYLGAHLAAAGDMKIIRGKKAGRKTGYIPKLEKLMLRRALGQVAAGYGYDDQTPIE